MCGFTFLNNISIRTIFVSVLISFLDEKYFNSHSEFISESQYFRLRNEPTYCKQVRSDINLKIGHYSIFSYILLATKEMFCGTTNK